MDVPKDVTVPGIGKKVPTLALAAGAAGVLAFAWWKRTRPAPPAGPDNAPTGDTGTGPDDYTAPGHITPSTPDTSGAIVTDQDWMARALDALSWYDAAHVSNVLARYLDRQEITRDEAQLVREAWAQVGHPPGGQAIRLAGSPAATPPPDSPPPAPTPPPAHTLPRTLPAVEPAPSRTSTASRIR